MPNNLKHFAINANDVAAFNVGGKHGIKPHIDEFGDVERHVLYALTSAHCRARELNRLGHA